MTKKYKLYYIIGMLRLVIFKLSICAVAIIGAINKNVIAQTNLSPTRHDTIRQITPAFHGFYTKYLDCDGIAIRSANVVDDRALYVASGKISIMLKHMDAARKNLVKSGAELHIIGKDQQTSDLPELAGQKGVSYMDHGVMTDIDKRTRGVGGLYASCGEENLLELPNDRYYGGSDICIHEFAHTIMNYGFDVPLREKIEQQYERALAKGLWKDAYAASNKEEYWAELSMWYFGKHGEFLRGTHLPEVGPEGLKSYDADGYKLLDSIYTGKIQPSMQGRAAVMVQKGAVSGPSIEKTEFTFTNHKNSPVKVYWIDYSGKAKLYATVKPQGHITQTTYVSHVWMFEDDKGAPMIYMQINDPPCNIELKD